MEGDHPVLHRCLQCNGVPYLTTGWVSVIDGCLTYAPLRSQAACDIHPPAHLLFGSFLCPAHARCTGHRLHWDPSRPVAGWAATETQITARAATSR